MKASIAMLYQNKHQTIQNSEKRLVLDNELMSGGDLANAGKNLFEFYQSDHKAYRLVHLSDLVQLGATLTPPPVITDYGITPQEAYNKFVYHKDTRSMNFNHLPSNAINAYVNATRDTLHDTYQNVFTVAFERDGVTEGNGFVPSDQPNAYSVFLTSVKEGSVDPLNYLYDTAKHQWFVADAKKSTKQSEIEFKPLSKVLYRHGLI